MAVSKNDVLSFISQYAVENKRNAPRKAIIDALGSEAGPVVDSLKKDGTITARRGRTGGLVVTNTASLADAPIADATSAEVETEATEPVADSSDDITAQFAMLMEKLEQDSVTEQAVAV